MNYNFYPNPLRWRNPKASKKLLALGFSALSLTLVSNLASANNRDLLTSRTEIGHLKAFDIIVKGKITDETGGGVPGAAIRIKNTSVVVTTDASGNYSVTIPETLTAPILVISYIGYATQEIAIDGRTSIDVKLVSTTNDLNEVVVIGYNTVKKSDLTGAVVSVSAADIRSRPVTNALQAIQGKAAGVDVTSNERPGEIGRILIRGVRSINAANSPLYVVDGIPLAAGGIEAINPNDIETIDILKDASATAVYGSRGANGVVLVSTKKGKAGRLNLDYVGTTTFETLNDRVDMMNSGQYIEFRRDAYRRLNFLNSLNGVTTPSDRGYPAIPTQADDNRIFPGDPYVTSNIAQGWQNGTFNGSLVPTTDWTDLVTRTGFTQDHVLSASGGTEKLRAYGSFGYLNQKGTQLGQDYTRYSTKVSIDVSPTKWFNMGVNLNASYGFQNFGFSSSSASGAGSLYAAARGMLPVAVPFDVNGNRINLPGGDINILNPVGEDLYNVNLRKVLRTIGSIYGEVTFFDGFKYRVNFGPDFYNLYNGRYMDAKSINRGAGEPGSSNYAQLNNNTRFAYTLDHLLYYNKTIKKHDFGVTLLQSSSSFREETSTMSANSIPLIKPLWYGLNAVSALEAFGNGLSDSRLESYMARINYSFNNKYLLTASARWDASSVLAKGYRWDFFPSTALAWRIEQEDFMKKIKWVDQLKLRVGFGSVGNSAVSPYSSLGPLQRLYYTFGNVVVPGYVASDPSQADPVLFPNKALGWEHTLQYNIGVDFTLLKGRIGGTIDVYTSKTTDLLLEKSVSPIVGYTSSLDNIGSTKNRGIDITLNTQNIKSKDFSWSSTLNFSANKDEITKLVTGNSIANNWFIGERISSFYDYEKIGIWQNTKADLDEIKLYKDNGQTFNPGDIRIKDLNNDHKIDANNDRRIVGSPSPAWTAGLTNTFTYKNFELSTFIFSRYNFLIQTGAESLQGRFSQRVLDYWTPTNPTNNYPAPNNNSAAGDAFKSAMNYQDGSFIKIRNITLSYYLPEEISKKLSISKLRVYAQAINPGMIYSKTKWLDADLGGSSFNRGFVFGVNVGF